MRLLLTSTSDGLLQFFTTRNPPPYAILSHTWVHGQEVLFEDARSNNPSICTRSGYQKILDCCRQAQGDGYDYVWIDTCCIDKSNSAELSETIISMHRMYQEAALCYVHLRDVSSAEEPENSGSEFQRSKWFTRGWTLQELIAPKVVKFYTSDWKLIGDKTNLARTIQRVTGVDYAVLRFNKSPKTQSIAVRMSWAANRKTTLVEDRAYSLMGLFGVNMVPKYGEGEKAFTRLQHKILTRSSDHSILAWNVHHGPHNETPILGLSPDNFLSSANISNISWHPFSVKWHFTDVIGPILKTPRGVEVTLPIFNIPEDLYSKDTARRIDAVVAIACVLDDTAASQHYALGLALRRSGHSYVRAHPHLLVNVDPLVSLGVPWTVEPLVLLDELEPTIATQPDIRDEIRLSIGSNTLKSQRYNGGVELVPSPNDPLYAGFIEEWGPLPRLPKQLNYERTRDGDLLLMLNKKTISQAIIFFEPRRGAEPHVLSPARVFTLTSQVNSEQQLHLKPSCVHEPGKQQMVNADLVLSNRPVGNKLQCECGLVVEFTVIPIDFPIDFLTKQNTKIFSYALEIRRRDNASWHTRKPAIFTAPRQISELTCRTLRWAESTAGFVPADAVKLDHTDACIARISFEYVSSQLSSEIVPIRASRRIPAVKMNGMLYAWPISDAADNMSIKESFEYHVLAGLTGCAGWVRCNDTFSMNAMGGAVPVEGGRDRDNAILYIARGTKSNHSDYLGVVKVGSRAHLGPVTISNAYLDRGEFDEYEVLIYAKDVPLLIL